MQSSSWTDQNWHKHGGAANTATGKSGNNYKKSYNKVEKALNKMLAQPVEMSKGRSLLEKMGWKGGGLGKDGDGIVEPIAPKATYATLTVGLGLPTETNETDTRGKRWNNNERKGKQKKPKMTKIKIPKQPKKKKEEPDFELTEEDIEFKKNFRQNVLLRILDFVKDDAQTQVVFNEQLTREERRDIHTMVGHLRLRKDTYRFYFENETEFEIVENILAHNHYILLYKSNGLGILRRVVLYKIAPDDIFLITPEDLRNDAESCNGVSIVKDSKDSEKVVETKCDEKAVDVEEDAGPKSKENITAFDEDVECMSFDTAAIAEEDDGAKSEENIIIIEDDETEENKDVDAESNQRIISVDKESEENYETAFNYFEDDNDAEINVNDGIDDDLNKSNKNKVINDYIKDKLMSRLIIFLKMFVSRKTFKELRFLGTFNEKEFVVIQLFFDICSGNVFDEKYNILEVLNHDLYNFVVGVDNNETFVIYRTMKDPTSY